MKKKKKEYYVDNKEFSEAVATHVRGVKSDISEGKDTRMITDYIADSFMKIANGLSRSPNFINYTYREDMVMDAVENCIKAINNYDIDKPTRTGKPNSFSYFTQICYFAFLRRIAKEKKQTEIRQRLIDQNSVDVFADFDSDDMQLGSSMIERMRKTEDEFYDEDLCTQPKGEEPLPMKVSKKKRAKRSAKKSAIDLDKFLG